MNKSLLLLFTVLIGMIVYGKEYPLIKSRYVYQDCIFYEVDLMDDNNTPSNPKDDFILGKGSLTDCLDSTHVSGNDTLRLVILKIKYYDDANTVAYKLGMYSGDSGSFLTGFISSYGTKEDLLREQ